MYTNHSLGTVPGQHFSQDWLSDGIALSHVGAPGSHLAVEDSVSQGWHYQLQIEFVSFQFKIFRITVGSTKAQSLLLIYLYLQFKIEWRHAQGFRARLSVMRLLLTRLLLFNIKLLLFVLWVYDKTIIFMKSNVVVSAQKVFSYRYWEINISQISVTALKQLIMDPYLTILWQNNAYQTPFGSTCSSKSCWKSSSSPQCSSEPTLTEHQSTTADLWRMPKPRGCLLCHQITRPFSQLQYLIYLQQKVCDGMTQKGLQGVGVFIYVSLVQVV